MSPESSDLSNFVNQSNTSMMTRMSLTKYNLILIKDIIFIKIIYQGVIHKFFIDF